MAVRKATVVGQIAMTAVDVILVAVLMVLLVTRRSAKPPPLMQSRGFSGGLLFVVLALLLALVWLGNEFYYVSLIMTMIVFLPPVLYFPILALLGGWDKHGLELFGLAADEAGLAYVLYYPAMWSADVPLLVTSAYLQPQNSFHSS